MERIFSVRVLKSEGTVFENQSFDFSKFILRLDNLEKDCKQELIVLMFLLFALAKRRMSSAKKRWEILIF